MSKQTQNLLLEIVALVALLGFGIAISLYYGRIGFSPLDQSIIFDGAWRLLTGQVPFRDFTAPNGFIPMFIQALFFSGFGVTWFAYCIHAAIFNGLFAIMSYSIFRIFQTPRLLALFYGLLSGVVFYPPFGVPYMEQHSFFFLTLMFLMLLYSTRTSNTRVQNGLWILTPIVFTIAYLSKQIPATFGLPLVALFLITWARPHWKRTLICFSIGTILSIGGLVLLALILQLDWQLLKEYYIDILPRQGIQRLSTWALEYPLALFRWNLSTVYFIQGLVLTILLCLACQKSNVSKRKTLLKILSGAFLLVSIGVLATIVALWFNPELHHLLPAIMARYDIMELTSALWHLLIGLAVCTGILLILLSNWSDTWGSFWRNGLPHLIIAEALILICLAFSTLACNQAANGIPYIFLSLGIVHVGLLKALPPSLTNTASPKPISAWWLITGLLVTMALWDGITFNQDVNRSRAVQDFTHVPQLSITNQQLPEPLKFMVWDMPSFNAYTASDLARLTEFLKNADGNFFLVGDSSILYGLTGRPSVHPSIFYHAGLGSPLLNTPTFQSYETQLLRNMKQHQVRYVILEGDRTQMNSGLEDFNLLSKRVKQQACNEQQFGRFRVIELCDKEK